MFFPIEPDYRIPGPAHRLGDTAAGTQRVELDAEHERYLAAKRFSAGLWDPAVDRVEFEPVVRDWLGKIVETDLPGRVDTSSPLDALVMQLQEDLVIMHCSRGQDPLRAQAVYLHVNLPSGWCPLCTVGLPFLRIHAPVPNQDQFGGPGRKQAAAALFSGQELVRFVWTLIPDDTLDRRRCHRQAADQPAHASADFSWAAPARLFLRVERQVIAPIDATTTGFLIRVYHTPVDTLTAARRSTLRAALAAMPEEIRRYKGLPENLCWSPML